MKKKLQLNSIVFIGIIATLCACSTVKHLPATVAGRSRAAFVGTWNLTNISYDGLLPGAVQTLFDQGSPADFNASTWKLTNSGNGIYTLANGISQTIFWSFDNNNGPVFQFKKLYQGDSARKIESGYQLIVASVDGKEMILKLPVILGSKTAYVILSFSKIQ